MEKMKYKQRVHPLYFRWYGMLRRCNNKSYKRYYNYGGRGIKVCEDWHRFEVFKAWALSSGYNDNLSIDRIDNNGNYEPSNCRWATAKEQACNRRDNIVISYLGKSQPVSRWAEEIGMKYITLLKRLEAGWSPERALTEPLRGGKTWTRKSG